MKRRYVTMREKGFTCQFNEGVNCDKRSWLFCYSCGWNPEESNKRKDEFRNEIGCRVVPKGDKGETK